MKVKIFLVLLSLSFFDCKKPVLNSVDSELDLNEAIVLFAVGETRIKHADNTEQKARIGIVIKTGDNIITGINSKIDIQFKNGSSIRIASNTTLDFSKLSVNKGIADTQITMATGKLFAKINKAKKDDNFIIVTPTAIAGVRGTSFIVNVNKSESVKVIDGSVAFANKELKNEVILEKNQEGHLSIKNIPVIDTVYLTKNDEEELATMVKVSESTLMQIKTLNEQFNENELDNIKKNEIDIQISNIQKDLIDKQNYNKKEQENNLLHKELKSKKDIVTYYERIEKIIMINGSIIIGAIINQNNDYLIIHTEDGIKNIKLDEIEEVIYELHNKNKF